MIYTPEFKDLIFESTNDDDFIGFGNPNYKKC